jgi:hypothetical protein
VEENSQEVDALKFGSQRGGFNSGYRGGYRGHGRGGYNGNNYNQSQNYRGVTVTPEEITLQIKAETLKHSPNKHLQPKEEHTMGVEELHLDKQANCVQTEERRNITQPNVGVTKKAANDVNKEEKIKYQDQTEENPPVDTIHQSLFKPKN